MDEAAALVEAAGRRTLRVVTDVGDEASIASTAGRRDHGVRQGGHPGQLRRPHQADADARPAPIEEWNDILETNLTGTLRACRVFGRHMIERRYGRIINIASLTSFVSMMEVAAYSASKAAVASLTKSLAVEWSRHGVMVNAIAPGVFRTALNQKLLDTTPRGQELLMRTPMGRFGRVEELAGAAVFLASDAASFVTGHMLVVDGGFLASGVNV